MGKLKDRRRAKKAAKFEAGKGRLYKKAQKGKSKALAKVEKLGLESTSDETTYDDVYDDEETYDDFDQPAGINNGLNQGEETYEDEDVYVAKNLSTASPVQQAALAAPNNNNLIIIVVVVIVIAYFLIKNKN